MGLLQGITDIAFGGDPETKLGLAASAGLVILGGFESDPARARTLRIGGLVLGAFFFFREQKKQGSAAQALTDEAAITPDAPGITWLDRLLGLAGRATGNQPDAGIEAKADRPADESGGPFLGHPKNLLLVAGKIRSPLEGETVKLPAFQDTLPADAAIENQSAEEVAGQVVTRVTSQGLLESEPSDKYLPGPFLRLAPGEFRELAIRVPAFRSGDGSATLALIFANFKLDEVRFSRELVLA